MNSLTICSTEIRQDADGRYCLNDPHKAAGAERRHEPLNWRNTDSFNELVAELSSTGNPVVTSRGRSGGTYVVKELVYAYAMWISPSFHLKVIRAYDSLVQQQEQPQHQIPQTRAEALRLAADLEEQNARLTMRIERRQKTRRSGLALIYAASASAVARRLGAFGFFQAICGDNPATVAISIRVSSEKR